jgi:hypothetical protein
MLPPPLQSCTYKAPTAAPRLHHRCPSAAAAGADCGAEARPDLTSHCARSEVKFSPFVAAAPGLISHPDEPGRPPSPSMSPPPPEHLPPPCRAPNNQPLPRARFTRFAGPRARIAPPELDLHDPCARFARLVGPRARITPPDLGQPYTHSVAMSGLHGLVGRLQRGTRQSTRCPRRLLEVAPPTGA